RSRDVLTFALERCLCPRPRLLCLGQRDQPERRQGSGSRSTWLPLIGSAGGAAARWATDVTTVTAHIDAAPDLARACADIAVGVASENQMSTTARRDAHPGGRKGAALRG